jgi:AraC family transcriptional regulator
MATMKPRETYHDRLLRVLVHIQHSLDDDLALENLARIARFSPFHFHRIFTGMVGESVMALVRRLRLERSARQLEGSGKPLVEIALDAGYETQESFTRAFRTAFGLPPGQFRKQNRLAPMLPAPSGVHHGREIVIGGFPPSPAGTEPMNVRIERREPMRVIFVRHVGPYAEVGKAWGELCGVAGPRGLLGGEISMFGLSYDDPAVTPPEKLRYDACIRVDAGVEVDPPLATQDLPAEIFAVTLHEGPYSELARTYEALYGRWLPDSGREPREGACMEHYLNDPQHTAPADLRTEIWVPVSGELGSGELGSGDR